MQQFVQRLNDLIRANAHHAIDRLEEPERMLKQYLRELDQELRAVRLQLASALAGEKRLAQQLEGQRRQIGKLAEQAEAALEEGDEDLARVALERRLEAEKSAQTLEHAHQKAAQSVAAVRERLARSEALREQAAHTRLSLVARYRAAATLHSIERGAQAQWHNPPLPDPHERIADLAERIADFEATAHGLGALSEGDSRGADRLELAERRRKVEAELERLKRRRKATK